MLICLCHVRGCFCTTSAEVTKMRLHALQGLKCLPSGPSHKKIADPHPKITAVPIANHIDSFCLSLNFIYMESLYIYIFFLNFIFISIYILLYFGFCSLVLVSHLCVVAPVVCSSSLLSSIPSYERTTICQIADSPLDYFQFGVIMNHADIYSLGTCMCILIYFCWAYSWDWNCVCSALVRTIHFPKWL